MRKLMQWSRFAAVAALVGTAGCKSLEVTNPNAPDAARAFSDPGAVAGLVTGAMRNWVQTRQAFNGALVLSTMADAYTASWNNFNLRYYTSYGNECAQRCGWDNRVTSNFRVQVETYWYGFYGILSSVNDVLTAIRINNVTVVSAANTKQLEAIAVMLQGVVFSTIALNYGGGPVGVETMAAALSEPRDAIEDIIEPFLIQKGLLQRTPRGRLLTSAAFKHLGLAEPQREPGQFGLFGGEETD